MPGPHRRFLEHIESVANIREYVTSTVSGVEVADAYNKAVASLTAFRNIHIQMVTRYVIGPSRKAPVPKEGALNLAVASTKEASMKELQGTGGTEMMSFLKQSRDETKSAIALQ